MAGRSASACRPLRRPVGPVSSLAKNKTAAQRHVDGAVECCNRPFKDANRAAGVRRFGGVLHVVMPPSWSRAKRSRTRRTPHTHRPDADNCLKALLDSTGRDDSHVHTIYLRKVWADQGAIEITDELTAESDRLTTGVGCENGTGPQFHTD
jgi:hypothetical protein